MVDRGKTPRLVAKRDIKNTPRGPYQARGLSQKHIWRYVSEHITPPRFFKTHLEMCFSSLREMTIITPNLKMQLHMSPSKPKLY